MALLTDIGNNLSNLFRQGSNFVSNDIVRPVEKGAANVQNSLQNFNHSTNNIPISPIPTIKIQDHPFLQNAANLPGAIGNMGWNVLTGLPREMINTEKDLGNITQGVVNGHGIPQYNQLNTGLVKTGYNIAAKISPQTQQGSGARTDIPGMLGDFASAVMPYLQYSVGKQAIGSIANPQNTTLINTLVANLPNALKTAIPFALAQGFISAKDTQGTKNWLIKAGVESAKAEALAAAFSTAVGAAGYGVKKVTTALAENPNQQGFIDPTAPVGGKSEDQNLHDYLYQKIEQVGLKGLDPEEKQYVTQNFNIEDIRNAGHNLPPGTAAKVDNQMYDNGQLPQPGTQIGDAGYNGANAGLSDTGKLTEVENRIKATRPDANLAGIKSDVTTGSGFITTDGTFANVNAGHNTALGDLGEGEKGLNDYLDMGGIRTRISQESGDINIEIHKPPTSQQMQVIDNLPDDRRYFYDVGDISQTGGSSNGTTKAGLLKEIQDKFGVAQPSLDGVTAPNAMDAIHEMQQQTALQLQAAAKNDPSLPPNIGKVIQSIDLSHAASPSDAAAIIHDQLPDGISSNNEVLLALGRHAQQAETILENTSGNSLNDLQRGGIDFSAPIGGGNERQFTTSVKESPEVSPDVQQQVGSNYDVQPNKVLTDNSDNLIQTQGLDKATLQVVQDLGQKSGVIADQTVSDAIAVAKAQDASGNTGQAVEIYNKLAEQLTKAGQTVQAASLLNDLTPEGMQYQAVKVLGKAGVDITPDMQTNIGNFLDIVKQTDPGTPERSLANQQLVNYVNSNIPRSKWDAFTGIWRTGLLTGPETVAKVAVSHAISTPAEMLSQYPAALADRGMSLFTGERSLTATTRGFIPGFAEGLNAANAKLTQGLDVPNSGGFESDFGSHTDQTPYENVVQSVHSAISKPAFMARFNVSLNDQALTEATNQGLTGEAKDAFVKDFVSNPPDVATQLAQNDAAIATNTERTGAGQLASQIQNFKMGPVPIGKFLVPFTRIPSAIGVNGLFNLSPLGVPKEIISQIQDGSFDQRSMAQAIGRSTTGTAIIALGAMLAEKGLMTLKAPADTKERALWDTQHKQPNSINLGGTWYSLNALGPVGIALGVGGGLGQALKTNGGDMLKAIPTALASGGRVLLDQPYLKGLSGVTNALNDPTRYATTLFNNTAGSFIPAFSSQIARGTDPVQRTFPSDVQGRFASEIPGAREGIPAQRDLYGNTIPGSNPNGTVGGGIAGTLNPFYPQKGASDPVSSELQRLYDTLGSSDSPAIGQPGKNQTINGQKVVLNPAQLQQLIQTEGPQVYDKLQTVITDPAYQQLSDEEKTNAINSALTAIHKQTNATVDLNSPLTLNPKAKQPAGTITIGSGGSTGTSLGSEGQPSISDGTKQFTIVDPTTGTVRTIDLSKPLVEPTPTGNAELDKKLVASYNSSLTSRANDIVTLYKNNRIDATTAEQYLEQLTKTGTGKKRVKISIKSATAPKTAAFKLSSSTLKLGKTKGLKIAAQPKFAKTKQSGAFKISATHVHLSNGRRLTA